MRKLKHKGIKLTLWNKVIIRTNFFFFFQAEDGIRDYKVTGVQTCALPISMRRQRGREEGRLGGRGRRLLAASQLAENAFHGAWREAGRVAVSPGSCPVSWPWRGLPRG